MDKLINSLGFTNGNYNFFTSLKPFPESLSILKARAKINPVQIMTDFYEGIKFHYSTKKKQ